MVFLFDTLDILLDFWQCRILHNLVSLINLQSLLSFVNLEETPQPQVSEHDVHLVVRAVHVAVSCEFPGIN